jgi:diguanylate cyclase
MKATGKREHWRNAHLHHRLEEKKPGSNEIPVNVQEFAMSSLLQQAGETPDEADYSSILPLEHPMTITYIASCQPGNRMIYVSPQIIILGFLPEAWLTGTDLRLQQVHEHDVERVSHALCHSQSTGETFDCCYRIYDSAGKIHWLHEEAGVVCDESGNELFISGVMLDISEKMELEQELSERRSRLERMVEQRTLQLLKRMTLLESCNASLCAKLECTHQALAVLKPQTAKFAQVSDMAGSMIVWRVAAAGEIS